MNTKSLPVDQVDNTFYGENGYFKIVTFGKLGPIEQTIRGTKKGVHDVVEQILLEDNFEYFQVEMIKE